MKTTALKLASYIVYKCDKDKKYINKFQLNYILYLIQSYMLKNGTAAFDDDFIAMKFGPVVPCVYFKYIHFAGGPVFLLSKIYIDKFPLDENLKKNIDCIIENARDMKLWDLIARVTDKKGAWYFTYHEKGHMAVIQKNLIKSKE